ncbi:MAG: TRAM domain-containing protein, partial [Casimicrobiaceae bacterium]
LQQRIDEPFLDYSRRLVGRTECVLVEARAKRGEGDLAGRTENNRVINFPGGPEGERLIGQYVQVRVTEAMAHSLRGEIITA